jgi:hypothetical protein
MGLKIFGVLVVSFLLGMPAGAQAAESLVLPKSGIYYAATLCQAKIHNTGRAIFLTPSFCQRAINGYRFELHQVSEDVYEGQGMRLEIWDDHTVKMLANGIFVMQRN